jgi:beta-barrel assembly-enhancing protease
MMVEAIYFDGESARDHAVSVQLTRDALVFSGESVPERKWSLSGLHSIDPPTEGQPFRISHDSAIGARLIVKDQAFIEQLLALQPALKGHYSKRHLSQVAYWTVGGLAVVAALGWLTLNVLPKQMAGLIPEKWRTQTGLSVEKQVVGEEGKLCKADAGLKAMGKIVAALAEGDPKMPPLVVSVYDLDILNAFAVPGARVIMTRELIEKAENVEEVAGVLAHEIGHVVHLHPEQQMIRVTGLQILISVVTGSNGGDLVTNIGGLAAVLRHNRASEREADTYARDTMLAARVNPLGFKTFFEKMLKLKGAELAAPDTEKSALERIGSVFSTHPDTQQRIAKVEPLPANVKPVTVLTPAEWQALRDICK